MHVCIYSKYFAKMGMHSTLYIYFYDFYDCTNIFNHINFKQEKTQQI